MKKYSYLIWEFLFNFEKIFEFNNCISNYFLLNLNKYSISFYIQSSFNSVKFIIKVYFKKSKNKKDKKLFEIIKKYYSLWELNSYFCCERTMFCH
jgi:hypothetical protein